MLYLIIFVSALGVVTANPDTMTGTPDEGKAIHTRGFAEEDYYAAGSTDLKLYSRSGISGIWHEVPNSCCIISMTTFPDGTILGVDEHHRLFTKSEQSIEEFWEGPIHNSCCVIDVTYLNDGTLLGIGETGDLWTRPGIEGMWTLVEGSCCVQSVSQLPSSEILGVANDGTLWTRAAPGDEATWEKVAASVGTEVVDVTVTGDGTIIGIDVNGLMVMGHYPFDGWTSIDDDDILVRSVSVKRSSDLIGGDRGYPHMKTFDGHAYTFQGECWYTLVRDCANEQPDFEITAKFARRDHTNKTMTVALNVTVGEEHAFVYGVHVTTEGSTGIVSGTKRILIHNNGETVVLGFIAEDTRFTLEWTLRRHMFSASLTGSDFQGLLCGLLGNADGDKHNDFQLPNGIVVHDVVEFGESWKVPGATCE